MKETIMLFIIVISVLFINADALNGGFGGPIIGGYYTDYSSINASLASVGMELKQMYYQTGGGGYGIINGLLIGGYGYSATQNINTSTLNLNYELSGGFFEIGRVWDLKFIAAGPYMKLGSGSEIIKLKPVADPIDFDSLLVNPGRTSELSRSGFEAGAGLVIMVPIVKWFSIMMKGGATYGPAWEWHLSDGTALLNPPSDRALRYEVNIGLMFGLSI